METSDLGSTSSKRFKEIQKDFQGVNCSSLRDASGMTTADIVITTSELSEFHVAPRCVDHRCQCNDEDGHANL